MKHVKDFYTFTLVSLSLLGVLFSFYLVILELITPGFCPRIGWLPACILVLIAYALIFYSIFISKIFAVLVFLFGFLSGFSNAVYFSYGEIGGILTCPRFFDFPMCFLSLTLLIIIFTIWIYRKNCIINKNDT